MNTIQLECFVAVAEHLNFSRASEELKITQPAVSHQIQALEEELGVKLFLRTSKSVSLTQEGLMFFPDAQLILKTALSAKERLGRHEHFIPFDIGCHNYMELALLPPVLKQLSEEFPLLRPSMHLMPFPAMQGMVINQQLHATFGIKDGHKKSVLNSPLAGHASLSKEDLSGNIIACSHRHISGSVFAVLNSILIGLPPEQRYFTENVESAFTLAKAQVGYTIYPDIPKVRDPELCYIPLKDVPELSFGVYYRRDDDHPVLKQFLRLMNRFFSENS